MLVINFKCQFNDNYFYQLLLFFELSVNQFSDMGLGNLDIC